MLRKTLIGLLALLAVAPAAASAAPELGTSHRLQDRRYIASAERAYVVGFEDGRFYANGWHIAGEMGGVWTPPLKLRRRCLVRRRRPVDRPRDPLPERLGLHRDGPAADRRARAAAAPTSRPDGGRAALFGLHVRNPGAAARTVRLKVDAHSELLGAYPWSFDNTPHARDNLADTAAFDGDALVFREQGKLPHPNAETHDWAALVAANRKPVSGETGATNRGDQGDNVCTAEEPPSQCDDGPFGRGKGGQLRYEVSVPAGATRTLWVAVAGSDEGPARGDGGSSPPRWTTRPARSRARSRAASGWGAGRR